MPRIRTTTFRKRKEAGDKVTVLTAYDYPTAKLLDECGIDAVLVGDSLGTVVQGNDDTLSVTMDQMIYHTSMVSRAVENAMVIGDMPFLSYQLDPEEAVRNAGRFVSEGGAQAVKLEGSVDKFGESIAAIVKTGIPVMGHIGFTPQSVHQIGGYKVQGRGDLAREQLKEEALGLQQAGCFSIVLELVQQDTAAEITEMLTIPTIGIGAGPHCDGQVLVMHDILGFGPERTFYKIFGNAREVMEHAFRDYIREVKEGTFPTEEQGHR
ncbi:MAG TPA: 3-methyl-2-oxobutanoate hydroxymethyltransferase [Candidatus Hydrogenedentes bacterium]|nr:3-methyl-2-oxobutanoate hydroxymethyltransferase [Candidatus Hydrogenedentota bacterium]HQM50467.1 3-methyl-2-oxobutanoate hydroxymethyltransferase [Candidatus Hydrogenedentota bacterium]